MNLICKSVSCASVIRRDVTGCLRIFECVDAAFATLTIRDNWQIAWSVCGSIQCGGIFGWVIEFILGTIMAVEILTVVAFNIAGAEPSSLDDGPYDSYDHWRRRWEQCLASDLPVSCYYQKISIC